MLFTIHKALYRTWSMRDPEVASKVSLVRSHFQLDQQRYTTGRGRRAVHTGIPLTEAIAKLKEYGKSDAHRASARITLNLVCRLTKSTNNGFRGFFTLPQLVKKDDEAVLVFCPPSQVEEAQRAGAKYAGGAELMNDIVEGKLKFTRCLATPEMIPTVTKLARILGPMGMMPNVKHGTLTTDIPGAISKCLNNIPYHVTKVTGVMNICAAKEHIEENVRFIIGHVNGLGMESLKKRSFVEQATLTASGLKESYKLAKQEYQQERIRDAPPSVATAPLQFAVASQ